MVPVGATTLLVATIILAPNSGATPFTVDKKNEVTKMQNGAKERLGFPTVAPMILPPPLAPSTLT